MPCPRSLSGRGILGVLIALSAVQSSTLDTIHITSNDRPFSCPIIYTILTSNDHSFGCPIIYTDMFYNASLFIDSSAMLDTKFIL